MAKVASENPKGSTKDRLVLSMIRETEADGRLAAGGTVAEDTGMAGDARGTKHLRRP